MFQILLLQLAVAAAAPVAAHPAPPQTNCAGVHCAPLGETGPRSDTRFGGENLQNGQVRSGFDSQPGRYGSAGADRNFDTGHDANFDRNGFDNSGTWPAH